MVVTGAGAGIMEAGHVGAGRDASIGLNILLPFEQSANPVMTGNDKLMTMRYFFTRKLMFVKETDAIVLFPGGFGTHDEGFEVLTLIQTGKSHLFPVVLVDQPGGTYWSRVDRVHRDGAEGQRADLAARHVAVPDHAFGGRGGGGGDSASTASTTRCGTSARTWSCGSTGRSRMRRLDRSTRSSRTSSGRGGSSGPTGPAGGERAGPARPAATAVPVRPARALAVSADDRPDQQVRMTSARGGPTCERHCSLRCVLAASAFAASADRPNVIFILADDLGLGRPRLLRPEEDQHAEHRPARRGGDAVHAGLRRATPCVPRRAAA